MTFNPQPKEGTIVNQAAIDLVRELIPHCEYFGGEDGLRDDYELMLHRHGPFQVHHIESKRMGGAYRDDSTSNLTPQCLPHHRMQHEEHRSKRDRRRQREFSADSRGRIKDQLAKVNLII